MKRVHFALIFCCIAFVSYTQEGDAPPENLTTEKAYLERYILPLIESQDKLRDKKIYYFNPHPVVYKSYGSWFRNVLNDSLGIDYDAWLKIQTTLNNNKFGSYYPIKSISKARNDKLIKSKKNGKKYVVLDVTPVVFVSENIYSVRISQLCYGMCTTSYLFIVEINPGSKELKIKWLSVGQA